MDIQQGADFTNSYKSTRRVTDGFRAGIVQTYALGQLIKLAPLDSQVYSDGATVIPTAAALAEKPMGVISEDWKGIDGAGLLTSYALNQRGSNTVKATLYGYHPSVLLDNTNGGASAAADKSILVSSQNAAGKCQTIAAGAPSLGAVVGFAMLPAAGIGSSLGAGALAAATTTATVTGTPAAGDVYTITLQAPYGGTPSNILNNGIAQTVSIAVTLTSATAASVTTAAAAIVAAINASSVSAFYLATNAAGVITITVRPAQFFVTQLNSQFSFFYITTAGTIGNALTVSGSVVGTGTLTAPTVFAGGTGYVGTVPACIMRL